MKGALRFHVCHRLSTDPRCVMVYFDREPTDAEMLSIDRLHREFGKDHAERGVHSASRDGVP